VRFGSRIYSLWKIRGGAGGALVLSILVALWSVQQISLFPPGLKPRKMEMATATAHVVVDTPKSTILDLRQDTYNLEALTNRAVLIGSVMASSPVRQTIASLSGIPARALQIEAPLTPSQPRAVADSGNQRRVSDILRSTDQYRLHLEANPTVPILDIYAQTPSAESATKLANAAVRALRSRLSTLAAADGTPGKDQIRVRELGTARGAVINSGVNWQVAMVAFVLTFGLSCASLVFLARVREGWRLAAASDAMAAE
jgi:hypothetical protein